MNLKGSRQNENFGSCTHLCEEFASAGILIPTPEEGIGDLGVVSPSVMKSSVLNLPMLSH